MLMSLFLKPDPREKRSYFHNAQNFKHCQGELILVKLEISKLATLLVLRVNYCIVNYTLRFGEGYMHLLSQAQPQTPQNTQKHKKSVPYRQFQQRGERFNIHLGWGGGAVRVL